MSTQPPENNKSRDWPVLILVLSIPYLVVLLPFASVIGARPEIIGAAIGALTTALVSIITVRAVRK